MTSPTPHETILGILAAEPQHGYQLLDHFNHPARLGRVWSMSTSQVYAVLKRLESDGDVVGEVVSSADAPDRTEYSITPAGEARLQAWLDDASPSPSIRRVRIDFISRLYVAKLLKQPSIEIIHSQLNACQLEKQRQIEAQSAEQRAAVEPIVEGFILGQIDAAIVWLEGLADQSTTPTQELESNGKN